ncbi:MAG: peptidylprolyl isomerase [Candidatus Latescibacteria bacterium]|nr:peptidylprolyl isomerase [Candidatus Latescibacterota bacterium]
MNALKWFVPLMLALCFTTSYGEEEVLDRIVAVVDDQIILHSELKENVRLEMFQRGLSPERDQEQVKALEKEILDGMIADQILLAKAKDDSVLVKQKEIDEVLQDQLTRIREQAGSEEAYQRQLEAGGVTERDLKKRFRGEIRNYLMKQKMLGSLVQEIGVSSREVEAFYETYKDSLPVQPERVHISHILIRPKVGGEDQDALLDKANKILAEAQAGADFSELARTYSQDPGSAQRGGDLGYFGPETMLPEFERVAFALQPGTVSDIVKTRLGYHIIRVEDRKGDRIHARHILLIANITKKDEEKALEILTGLREKIRSGADFGELARTFSDDPPTASEGGDLGWIPVERLPSDFKPVTDQLEPGQVSEPVQSSSGYHLIRLNEREKGGTITLQSDRALLENLARQQKLKEGFDEMIEKERARIYVDVRLE